MKRWPLETVDHFDELSCDRYRTLLHAMCERTGEDAALIDVITDERGFLRFVCTTDSKDAEHRLAHAVGVVVFNVDILRRARRRLLAKLLRERAKLRETEADFWELDEEESDAPPREPEELRSVATWANLIAARLENHDPEAERQRWSERMGRVKR